jgi:hypothetical protein
LDTDLEKQILELLNRQLLINIGVASCLMEVAHVVPSGENRGRYLEKIGPLLENVKSFNSDYLRIMSITDEVPDEI